MTTRARRAMPHDGDDRRLRQFGEILEGRLVAGDIFTYDILL